MKKYSVKKSLIASLLILCLSFSMLIGTTFAWFTDSVTSGNNVITTGNLDIALDYWDGDSWETVEGTDKLFTGNLWEPGHTEIVYLRLSNLGSLALKYQLGINIVKEVEGTNVAGNSFKLSDYIYMGVVDGVKGHENAYTKDVAGRLDAIADAEEVGKISAGYTANGSLTSEDEPSYMAVVVYMPTTVGNEANHKTGTTAPYIELGVNLVATQHTYENDSFGNQYDVVDVVVPSKPITLVAAEAPSATTKKTSVVVPPNTYKAGDSVSIDVNTASSLFDISNGGSVVGTIDVVLSVNGTQQKSELQGDKYRVTTYIATGLDASTISVVYTGTDGRSQPTFVSYNATTGELVFETSHFSEYEISAKVVAYDVEKDAAYSNGAAVVEALKSNDANVVISESIPASDKVVITDAIANDKVGADVTVTMGDKGYTAENLKEALAVQVVDSVETLEAAIAKGGSILLGKTITITETIEITKDVELDLGKYTIEANVNKARAFKVAADGVNFVLNANSGTVTFDNGTYGVIEIKENLDGVNVTVNGGTFKGTTDEGALIRFRNGKNHTVTLNDVTYTDNCLPSNDSSNAFIFAYNKIQQTGYAVTINGGEYTTPFGIASATIALKMNGVTMNTQGLAVEAANAEIVNCTINVDPGYEANGTPASGIAVSNNGKIKVEGTTINSANYGLCVLPSGGIIEARACTIVATNGNKVYELYETAEEGKIIFAGQPVAIVNNLGQSDIVNMDDKEITLDCSYQFLPTHTLEEALDSGYGLWHADFVIKFDKDVENVSSAGLAGYYSAWCELIEHKWVTLDVEGISLVAGEEIRLVDTMGVTVSYKDICTYAIREENKINGFLCGAYADGSLDGVTMTVELRLYEVGAQGDCEINDGCTHPYTECETGNYIVIGSYSHTFDNK